MAQSALRDNLVYKLCKFRWKLIMSQNKIYISVFCSLHIVPLSKHFRNRFSIFYYAFVA